MDYSPAAAAALSRLRDASHFDWMLVPILGFVVYLYCQQAAKRSWNIVVAGLAYYAIEWIGEIGNSLILHLSGYAPLWGEPGPTSYLILVGINVETTLMFMVFGLAVGHVLTVVKQRWLVVFGFSLFCVLVETLLNAWGALSWDWRFWGWPHIYTVILGAYGPAVVFTIWVHDLASYRKKLAIIGGVFAVDAIAFAAFVKAGWI
jgi:hypothetical protein